ncbi:glycosyltransferase family 4 protein [Chryseobacterium capnotolerans]|uniref:glycosyltransferase family 4 protein n=1 Tax=Chryseobacterium TaxID=59732 RepID=UPI000839D96A|nr:MULTISPECIES: glycosyltransferase family 4 protein [Chryseobacterium]UHO40200.1 glycosyltransferase family 4 protein [Chryseobacterium capnotolerans]
MRIIAVHLLNDYSGSPKVLMQLLKIWTKNGKETHLFIGGKNKGFLSDISGIHYHGYEYRFSGYPIIRLLFFIISQFALAIRLLFFLKKQDIVYINTVLPFGAAVIAKLKGCRIVYHVHETSVKPQILKKFLFGIASVTASEVKYVSQFLALQEPICKKSEIIYNVLEEDFIEKAVPKNLQANERKIVLMLCSLKKYKGVDEFVTLSEQNPEFTFKLVLNASVYDIHSYFEKKQLPENLYIYPTQQDTHRFYKEADVILNLSDTKLWVETFGLTILEGMAYGLPAIVPPIGGVTELIDDGKNGFCINSKEITVISQKLKLLLNNPNLYQQFSLYAQQKSKLFSIDNFEKQSLKIFSKFH